MDVELEELLSDVEGLKKATTSFEDHVLFALNLSGGDHPAENGHPLLNEVPSNVIQESDHEIRLMNVTRPVLDLPGINKLLYRALTCTEMKKMFTSNMNVLSKVLPPNSYAQASYRMDTKTNIEGCVMIAGEEFDLESENEADYLNYVPPEGSYTSPQVDSFVLRSSSDDDASIFKHIMITDDLKFHCKLCGSCLDAYPDLFSHLNSALHQTLTNKEERRLEFVHRQNFLRKVKQMRELLAEECAHISFFQGENYSCKLCDKCFSCETDMFVHVTTVKHQLLKVRAEKRDGDVNGTWRLLRANSVLQRCAAWQCSVCDVAAMTLAEAMMHIKKKVHKGNLVRKHEEEVCGTGLPLAESGAVNVFSHAKETLDKVTELGSKSSVVGKNKSVVEDLPESTLRLATKEENELLQNKIFREEYKYIFYMGKGIFLCKLCSAYVSAYGVDYHVYNKFHAQALEENAITHARLWFIVRLLEQGDFGNVAVNSVDPSLFECRLCSVTSMRMEDVLVHVASEEHAANLRQGLVQYRKLSGDTLACRLCHAVVENAEYVAHVNSESHRAQFSKHVFKLQLRRRQQALFCKFPQIWSMHEEYLKPASEAETWCVLCKCNVPLVADDVWAHVTDSYHVSHMNYCLQKMFSNYEMVAEDKAVDGEKKNLEIRVGDTEDANILNNDDDFSQVDVPCSDHVQDSEENGHSFREDFDSSVYSKLNVIPDSLRMAFSSWNNFSEHCAELRARTENDLLQAQNSRIISVLELIFRPVFPDCRAVVFGSRMAGFAVHSNDVDVYLDVGDDKLRSHEHHVPQRLFVGVGCRLLSSHRDCRNLKEVPYARTPIVRFTYLPLGIDCDLNFMNEMSVQNTKLVRFYSTLDERVKMLILFLRHWAKSTGATRLGTLAKISNYAVTLLVIFFLQQLHDPVVPTVEFLQAHHVGDKLFIRGWNCSFTQDLSAIPETCNTTSTAQLVHDFFEFYGSLDFAHAVLCPHCGRGMPRRAFIRWMSRQQAHDGDGQREKFRIKSPMCVQDPFDLAHNVTKGVTGKCLSAFQLSCRASAHLAEKLCAGQV